MAELNKGTDKAVLRQKLQDMGIAEEDAKKYVFEVQQRLSAIAAQEQMAGTEYLPAAIGGMLAAVLGGLAWGMLKPTAAVKSNL